MQEGRMDLTGLVPIDFRSRLDNAESLAITVRKRHRHEMTRAVAGLIVGGSTIVSGTILASLAMDILVTWLGVLPAVAIFTFAVIAIIVTAFAATARILHPPERRLLPKITEPDAKYFLDDNWSRRERLLNDVQAFNATLESFKALPERSGEDEIGTDVVADLSARRARIEEEINTYLSDFSSATAAERELVYSADLRGRKRLNPHRQSLKDFRQKVKKLERLERSLDALTISSGDGVIPDIAPYLYAQRFRAELEEERAMLIRHGFKPKRLRSQRINKKFLPSGT
jgi:hypothetical protein